MASEHFCGFGLHCWCCTHYTLPEAAQAHQEAESTSDGPLPDPFCRRAVRQQDNEVRCCVFHFTDNHNTGRELTSLLWSWLTLACIMMGWSSMDVKGMVSGCCLYFFCRKEEHFTRDISAEQQKKSLRTLCEVTHAPHSGSQQLSYSFPHPWNQRWPMDCLWCRCCSRTCTRSVMGQNHNKNEQN